MKTRAWNLIVIPPRSPRVDQFHFSWRAGAFLAGTCVCAFLVTILLFLMFPHLQAKAFDRKRLEAENQSLKVDNTNLSLKIRKLDDQINRAEEHSREVEALMQTD